MIFFKPTTETYLVIKTEKSLGFELSPIAFNVLVYQKDIRAFMYLNAFGLKLFSRFVCYDKKHIEILETMGIIKLYVEK